MPRTRAPLSFVEINWVRARNALELVVESASWEHQMCSPQLEVPLEFWSTDCGQLAVKGVFAPAPGGRDDDSNQAAEKRTRSQLLLSGCILESQREPFRNAQARPHPRKGGDSCVKEQATGPHARIL